MLQGSNAIGVLLHSLKQDKHLTVWSLWEQVYCHSLDWMKWDAFYSIRWGPAETAERGTNISPTEILLGSRQVLCPTHLLHKVAHGCPGVAGNIEEPLDVLSFPDGQNHLRI